MNLTFEQILTLLGLIGAAVGFIFAKPTIDAFIRLGNWWYEMREKRIILDAKRRQQIADERRLEEERHARTAALDQELNDKGYKLIVRRQDRRITELETDHRQCREDFSALSVKYDTLQQDYTVMKGELRLVRDRLELLAPGITDASDSKTARFFRRLAARKGKKLNESGELDVGPSQE